MILIHEATTLQTRTNTTELSLFLAWRSTQRFLF